MKRVLSLVIIHAIMLILFVPATFAEGDDPKATQTEKAVGVVNDCCTVLRDLSGGVIGVKFTLKEQPGDKYTGWFDTPEDMKKKGIEGLYNGLMVEITYKQANNQRNIVSIRHMATSQ